MHKYLASQNTAFFLPITSWLTKVWHIMQLLSETEYEINKYCSSDEQMRFHWESRENNVFLIPFFCTVGSNQFVARQPQHRCMVTSYYIAVNTQLDLTVWATWNLHQIGITEDSPHMKEALELIYFCLISVAHIPHSVRMMHIGDNELGHNWSKLWPVACSAPNHCLHYYWPH